MGARVAVAGAGGYAGGELLRLLAGPPALELGPVTAESNAGRPIAELHPHLAGLPSLAARTFDAADALVTSGCDLAFLALPAGQSARLAGELGRGIKIVDLGPDFRLADAGAWTRHYQVPHAGRWATGLPELPGARERIRAARRVAVPGCYATAAIVALAALPTAGLIDPDHGGTVAPPGTASARRPARPGRGGGGERRPRKGRRRPGHPERQPRARPAGAGRPHRLRGRAMNREPKGRGAAWTEEPGTSDEGRRGLQAPRRRAGETL